MREQFLAGAATVAEAVADPAVAAAWQAPSVLAGQTVGSLAGHLARGSVWVVAEYLDRPEPTGDGVDIGSAPEYYRSVVDAMGAEDHAAVRERGAAVAAAGRDAVTGRLASALGDLRTRLPAEPSDRRVAVYAGRVMLLDDYLVTRIVEQVVHLDDLARSLGREPWPNPPGADELVVACGAETGRLRFGGPAMLRALFRDGAEGVLPVL